MNYQQADTLVQSNVRILNFLPDIGMETPRKEILEGLFHHQKYLSPKFFYDKKGSLLFESITKLKEYYPSRTEMKILSTLLNHLDIDFSNKDIIELGSGDSSKISLLFDQIGSDKLASVNYFPLDISISAIKSSIKDLDKKYTLNSITGIVSDFFHTIEIPKSDRARVYCFFGSTLGNFSREEIESFLKMLSQSMRTGDHLILGVDMIKDINILEDAYNDSYNITAAFNKNILNVINKLIGTQFDTADFAHLAYFNPEKSRIEMHLRAKRDLAIRVGITDVICRMKRGETIHTENSHKFSDYNIHEFEEWSRLELINKVSDEKNWFNLIQFRKP